MFIPQKNVYYDYYPQFKLTTYDVDTREEVIDTLSSFDEKNQRLGVKKIKNERHLIILNKNDLSVKNKIFAWFGFGKLANTNCSLYGVCEYLARYDFKECKDDDDKHNEAYLKVCNLAGDLLLKPTLSLYHNVADQYAKKPEQLATLNLWIKNSEETEENLNDKDPYDKKQFTVYTNPAITDKHKKVMKNLFIWSHPNL